MDIKFANNASTALAGPIEPSTTSIDILPDTGLLFPILTQDVDYFLITVVHPTSGYWEIMKVTDTAGDVFTVERGQENSTAQAFPQNSLVENRFTAGSLDITLNGVSATHTSEGRVRLATVEETRDATIDDAVCITPFDLQGFFLMPGVIVAYSGLIDGNGNPIDRNTGKPNKDWQVCDGTQGTPDLRGKFIISAGSDVPEGSTGGQTTLSGTVKIGDTKLTSSHLPAINGEAWAQWEQYADNGVTPQSSGVLSTGPVEGRTLMDGGSWNHSAPPVQKIILKAGTASPLAHTHTAALTFTWSSSSSGGGGTSSSGEADFGMTYPPFYALSYIMKVS